MKNIMAAAVFLLTIAVYTVTLPRTVFVGDSGEFITAGATLGVPHAPGYPLYVILAKAFSFLPFGSLEFRITLLSAVAASLGLVFLYLFLVGLWSPDRPGRFGFISRGEYIVVSAATVLLLGFSRVFWSQAIFAKVYALAFLALSAMLWCIGRFLKSGQRRDLLTCALLGGIGVSLHQMMLLFIPIFILAIAFGKPPVGYKGWISAAGVFLVGLSAYALVPLLSLRQPALDSGMTYRSLEIFFKFILRAPYADYGAWSGWGDKLQFFHSFARDVYYQYGILALLILPGIVVFGRLSPRLGLAMVGIFAANSFGIIFLRSVPYSLEAEHYYRTYYLPAFAITASWIGLGALGILALLVWRSASYAKFSWAVPAALIILVGSMLWSNYPANNLRRFRFLNDYSRAILTGLKPNAVLVVAPEGPQLDTFFFMLLYQHVAAGVRPDVTVVGYPTIFKTPDGLRLERIYQQEKLSTQRRQLVEYVLDTPTFHGRPVYTTFLADSLQEAGRRSWVSLSNGVVYRLIVNTEELRGVQVSIPSVSLSDQDRRILENDYFGADLLAQYYYAQAALKLEQGEFRQSQDLYRQGIQHDNEPAGYDSTGYRQHRQLVLSGALNKN